MSENNLKIRQKFVNKILSKISDLQENVDLLVKVDRKILRNNLKQYGGSNTVDIRTPQTTLAAKIAMLKSREADLRQLKTTAAGIKLNLQQIQDEIDILNTKIADISFTIPEDLCGKPADGTALKYEQVQLDAIIEAFKNNPVMTFEERETYGLNFITNDDEFNKIKAAAIM